MEFSVDMPHYSSALTGSQRASFFLHVWAPLSHRFTGNRLNEIQTRVFSAEVVLFEGERVSAWSELRSIR